MDDLIDHQRRQEDDEFWDAKQRDAARPRNVRAQEFSAPNDDAPATMTSIPANDEVRQDDADRTAGAAVFRNPTPARPAAKKRRLFLLYLIALLVFCAVGYQGFRLWRNWGTSDETAALATASAAPAPELPPVLGTPVQPSLSPSPTGAAIQPLAPALPAGPTPEQIELNARLDRLEARLSEVIEGMRAHGYIVGDAGANGAPLPPTAFAPHQVTPPVVAAPLRRTPVRRPVQRAPEPKAPEAPRQQLMSVDMWNGRPSVVVSNGDPKNPQVRILQQGDSFNGITLNSVDVAGQRATFTDGVRSISLGVSN